MRHGLIFVRHRGVLISHTREEYEQYFGPIDREAAAILSDPKVEAAARELHRACECEALCSCDATDDPAAGP